MSTDDAFEARLMTEEVAEAEVELARLLLDIVTGARDAQLDQIADAVRSRRDMQRMQKAAVNKATLSQGVRVRIANIRPQYMDGATGVVDRVVGGRVRVVLDSRWRVQRFRGSATITVPTQCVERLGD